jgi:TPR repeat protein
MSELPNLDSLYAIEEELGRGAMGIVYRAREFASGREVALKLLQSAGEDGVRSARFMREGELGAQLKHPGIVRVHRVGLLKGHLCLAFELVPGCRTLAVLLPQLPTLEAVRLIADAAHALGAAHAAGLVHRDVKGENLLVDELGVLRVADFGVATGRDLERLTLSGVLVGTPLHMAPEQIDSLQRGAIGPPTDVWALGLLLYEALTGRHPFAGTLSLADLLVTVLQTDIPPPPGVSKPLASVCMRALERDPSKRFADGEALALALEEALTGDPAPGGRGQGAFVALGLALVVVVGAAVAWATRSPAGEASPREVAAPTPSGTPGQDSPPPPTAPEQVTPWKAQVTPLPAALDRDYPNQSLSFQLLVASARKGDFRASVRIARALRDGGSVQADPDASLAFLKWGASCGANEAMVELGKVLRQDPDQAREGLEWWARGLSMHRRFPLRELIKVSHSRSPEAEFAKDLLERADPKHFRNYGKIFYRPGPKQSLSEAGDCFLRAAKQGETEALAFLVIMLDQTQLEADPARRARALLEPCEAEAAAEISKVLMWAGEVNPKLARAWLERAAAANHPPSLARLAKEVESEPDGGGERAFWLRQRAVRLDDTLAEAHYHLGKDYSEGWVTGLDRARAREHLARAIAGGYRDGWRRLARLARRGDRTPCDPQLALSLYAKGAELGDSRCLHEAAQLHWEGTQVPHDLRKVEALAKALRKAGNARNLFWFSRLARLAGDRERALKLAREGAAKNNGDSMYMLATLLLEIDPGGNQAEANRLIDEAAKHYVVEARVARSLRLKASGAPEKEWLKDMSYAASREHPRALALVAVAKEAAQDYVRASLCWRRLGAVYRYGLGVPRAPERALSALRKAANHDDRPALLLLADMAAKGEGQPRSVTASQAFLDRANALEPDRPLPLPISAGGLRAEYFDLPGPLEQIPVMDGLQAALVRVDPLVDFRNEREFHLPFPPDTFAVRWRGILTVEEAATYTFVLGSDDGARLGVAGRWVIMNDTRHDFEERRGAIKLPVGEVPITVEFFENDGKAGCQLSWFKPGGIKRVIPQRLLRPPPD